jgi:ubiquinone/menaquinone biosynthesis C-methylase UbiE
MGMDISQTFVEIAQTNARQVGVNAVFVQGDASNMPFDDESYDFIVCTAAFKNFTKPIRALNEVYRVLKPNGIALIIDLRRDASKETINQEVNQMGLGLIDTFLTKLTFKYFLLKNAYTKDEFHELVTHTNFRKCRIPEDSIGMEIWLKKMN